MTEWLLATKAGHALIGLLAVIVAFAASGLYFHHTGYASGEAAGTARVEALTAQYAQAQAKAEETARVAQTQADAAEAAQLAAMRAKAEAERQTLQGKVTSANAQLAAEQAKVKHVAQIDPDAARWLATPVPGSLRTATH